VPPPPPAALAARRVSGRFSGYEMTLLWNRFKTNFPTGKCNKLQIKQLLHQVMPQGI